MSSLEALIQAAQYLEENGRELCVCVCALLVWCAAAIHWLLTVSCWHSRLDGGIAVCHTVYSAEWERSV